MRIVPSLLVILVLAFAARPATSLPVKVVRMDTRSSALASPSSSAKMIRDGGDFPWETVLAVGGGLAVLGGGAFGLRWLLKGFQGAREMNTSVFPMGVHQIGHRAEESSLDEKADKTKLIEL
ncbi:hypothetical protein OC846_004461 [Tilletia horrida]|uniref:Uncharacterized protein n=1 Tax=Tilletia horrida TaxID=155126 RepID=A0AAN6JSS2_9BASI|nr:hypothetical protein OC846_004461 [Tilletia horrida]KAK0549422.1 hypothetical protein OC845_003127 [Tilletia horrida]KAK0561331.1 hypothetical protein OC861_005876 [Tilletia horrida]